MWRRSPIPALLLIALLFAVACRKDPALEEDGFPYAPTPYSVALPPGVLDSLGPMPVPPGEPLTMEGVALGRKLFYENLLSDDMTMNCGTCHLQSAGFSDPRAVSIGTNGSPGTRNAMALVNLAWSNRFFWDGRRTTLEGQAHDPVVNPVEMANTWPVVVSRLQAHPDYPRLFHAAFGTSTIDSLLVTKAIAQFERTLVSFNSPFDRYWYGGDHNALTPEQHAGLAVYRGVGLCENCHALGLSTDDQLRVIGLEDPTIDPGVGGLTGHAEDMGRFKVPTLRNIARTGPYMHDGRFPDLNAVIVFYDSHVLPVLNLDSNLRPIANLPQIMTDEEEAALQAFLHAFTDDAFLNNPAFAPPGE